MSVTDQAMLDAIDDAILSIVSGTAQSTSKGNGQNFTRLPLDVLEKMKVKYEARIAAETRGTFYVAQARDQE